MSDTRLPDDLPEDELLAAEYVLGVLDADERRRVERRARSDGALQRRIEAWEHRFAPMLADEREEAPPATTWDAVETQLDRMIRFRSPAAAPSASARGVSRLWKWFGLGSFGLLAASLAMLFVVTQPRVGPPSLAAVIAPEGGAALYAAVIDPRTSRATLIPVSAGADAAHSNELWLIGADGTPRSLGLLPTEGPAEVVVAPELLVGGGGAALAVSREPPGGSPTGKPTGPVIGVGQLRRI
ncbi:anti-sigma factor [Aureimonas leprariae]|uniref:Anti-sigma factor n=1 Tax=Plantimonas leprariae TaxID=2615207 RepID=A0A7V7PM34_9HYPH|nr:anti-sigma factor [Aureimonas leprariae]KAB0677776.1 anti-sigma factor [Aureimonas leprariae]